MRAEKQAGLPTFPATEWNAQLRVIPLAQYPAGRRATGARPPPSRRPRPDAPLSCHVNCLSATRLTPIGARHATGADSLPCISFLLPCFPFFFFFSFFFPRHWILLFLLSLFLFLFGSLVLFIQFGFYSILFSLFFFVAPFGFTNWIRSFPVVFVCLSLFEFWTRVCLVQWVWYTSWVFRRKFPRLERWVFIPRDEVTAMWLFRSLVREVEESETATRRFRSKVRGLLVRFAFVKVEFCEHGCVFFFSSVSRSLTWNCFFFFCKSRSRYWSKSKLRYLFSTVIFSNWNKNARSQFWNCSSQERWAISL